MKFTLSPLGQLALLAATASAFPGAMMDALKSDPALAAEAENILKSRQLGGGAEAATAIFEPVPVFVGSLQYVDVSPGSGHEFVPPGKNDLRGPCPGLNAFANHNFLPHNGYATIEQFIDATMNVVGMGVGLASFLATFGAVVDGSGTAWSIGGTPSTAVGGALGHMSNGISGSHNKYESDASPTRPDLYEYGNDYKARPQQFAKLIEMSPGGQVTLDSLTAFRSYRFDTQIANNPYFFNGPFTGVLVQPAAYTFIYRFMANHSEEYPYGYLSYSTIESWFAMTKKGKGYTVQQGWERIPDDWYKRAVVYPYEQSYFVADAANAGKLYPKFFDVGGNTGKVNTFSGVNVDDLTGGVFNSSTLGDNDNFACLAYQFSAQVKPDVAQPVITELQSVISTVTQGLNCPQLGKIDFSQLKKFPGYKRSHVAPS